MLDTLLRLIETASGTNRLRDAMARKKGRESGRGEGGWGGAEGKQE